MTPRSDNVSGSGTRFNARSCHESCPAPLALPSFVALRQDPRPGEFLRDYWSVSETGNWSRDVALGRAHAREAVRFMREERAPHVLNWIASEIIRKRHFGPVEVGFFQELGALVLRAKQLPSS